jgi:formate dehydrogenase accessory protein FdhE
MVPPGRLERRRLKVRGGPAAFHARRQRALVLADSEPAMREPLRFAAAVLSYQETRLGHPSVELSARHLASSAVDGRRLDLGEVVDEILQELDPALGALVPLAPSGLAEASEQLTINEIVAWASDPDRVSPAQRMWIQVAAAPIVEQAAGQIRPPAREAWSEASCPICGDAPRLSVIVEESGEFMRGSPRYLVCGRCASWWVFSRAVCPECGEHHPDHLALYNNDRWPWARIDSCLTCRSFIKTFDLRQPGAGAVVPLIDDLATVTLDFWAVEQGLTGISRSGLRTRPQ